MKSILKLILIIMITLLEPEVIRILVVTDIYVCIKFSTL
jgi:hypothetical protein